MLNAPVCQGLSAQWPGEKAGDKRAWLCRMAIAPPACNAAPTQRLTALSACGGAVAERIEPVGSCRRSGSR